MHVALDLPHQAAIRPRVIEPGTALLPISSGQHHLALIAGLPCSQSYLIADLCRELFARRHGACDLIVVKDLDPDTVERISAATGPVLFLAEGSDRALADVAREAAFPIVVLNQRFSKAAHDFMATHGVSLQDTMRTMVRAQIGIEGIGDIPRATVLELRPDDLVAGLVERIAAALALPTADLPEMVVNRDLARPLATVLEETHPAAAPDDEAAEALQTLEAFYGFHPEGSGGVLQVPLAALHDGAPPHLPATNAIDLTGVPRCLTFGPYFHLPKGRWNVRFTFHSAGNISSNTLGFDIAADHEVKVDQYFDVTASGKFAFDCEFTVDDPYAYLEFRTYVLRGAIEGQFRPLSLTIESCPESRTPGSRTVRDRTAASVAHDPEPID
jgi:hypothetical protein